VCVSLSLSLSVSVYVSVSVWPPLRPLPALPDSVEVCFRVLQCAAGCCSMLQGAAGCCSVLQCVAVCCRVLQRRAQRRASRTSSGRTRHHGFASSCACTVAECCCSVLHAVRRHSTTVSRVRAHALLQCVVAVCYSQKTRHHGFASPHARTVAVLLQCVVAECCCSVLQSENTAPRFCEFVCMHWMSEVELLKS